MISPIPLPAIPPRGLPNPPQQVFPERAAAYRYVLLSSQRKQERGTGEHKSNYLSTPEEEPAGAITDTVATPRYKALFA